ncbi:MAG: glycoside hydrolase family 9 protein, partial [Acidobacteriaceae bacterium]
MDPLRPIRRRPFLQSIGAAAAASTLPQPLRALSLFGSHSTHLYLNQLGYLPHDAKIATVVHPSAGTQPATFKLWSQQPAVVVLEAKLTAPARDAASGDTIAQADFSSITTPGTYHLEGAGAHSDPFPIGPQVYADALRLTTRGYYGQRCGCAVDLGNGYKHPACHLHGAFDPTSGRSGPMPNTGGWHDAGDYGRYVVNSGISTGTLLWAWELFPDALRNLHLDIPESGRINEDSGKPLPDFLAEIKWNLDWMLSMQDPTDGGVWHKQTSLHFCAFIMPQDDTLISEVIGTGAAPYKSTCATADLASVAAIAARCYAPFDPAYAARCLTAARRAWARCVQHPSVTFTNPPTVSTGAYSDPHCSDELLWCSAELFRSTREPQYETAVLEAITPHLPTLKIGIPSWGDVASLGLWSYAFATSKSNPANQAIQQATQTAAAELISRTQQNGYGNSLALTDYHWGSNSNAANQSLLLLIANHFHPNPAARNAALANLHYLLGRNCFGVSWVTQLGRRPFQHPHHRPSAADGIAAPWPGLLSGGPNAHGGDPVADALPKAPPMRMWIDDQRAYSLNEIAINWNAPLVFLLAAANS